MTSRYVDQAARVGKMTAALRRHLAGDAFECGRKRQAAYIIEDIDPEDCIALDREAFRIEGVRRDSRVRAAGAALIAHADRWLEENE